MTEPSELSRARKLRAGDMSPGPVIIIGGAEDKLRDRVILSQFVRLAGGPDAHIVVISTASSLGDEATALYRQLFTQLGAGNVSVNQCATAGWNSARAPDDRVTSRS